MSLEGELRVDLRVRDGRIDRIGVHSTRPDIARALLQGRLRTEAVAAVPQLFSICANSQAAAAALACDAAAGETAEPERLASAAASVGAEMVREYASRTLLEVPRTLGEAVSDEALAAARAALHLPMAAAAGSCPGDDRHGIALATFGVGAEDWLALQTLDELDRWAAGGATATARFIHRLRRDEAAAGDLRDEPDDGATPLLANSQGATWIGELATACAADSGFARAPLWRGAPAETGALARQQSAALIAAFGSRPAARVCARFVARLHELALLLAARLLPALGAVRLPDGAGIAWVENARGLLLHRVQLDGHRVCGYAIVAPTDWNFHPGGALAAALLGSAATDLDAVQRFARRVADSLDPCVACRIGVDHA